MARSSGTFLPGHIVSEETRKKIGEKSKGRQTFIGRVHTEETKKKLSKPKTEEHKKKLSAYRAGKTYKELGIPPVSDETRLKMSINNGQRGSKSIWWKNGRMDIRDQIRSHFAYRQWRCDIFQRDNYSCQICGKKGGVIQADHIKTFSSILDENNIMTISMALECEELWNINNGRTLCEECHKKTDTYLNMWHDSEKKSKKK